MSAYTGRSIIRPGGADTGAGPERVSTARASSAAQLSTVPWAPTQFFEFLQGIVDAATDGDTVHLAPVLIQPMAADDARLDDRRTRATRSR
ncbi:MULTISPECIES: hypothetical protein [unclassified Micromonospora]|uniref:hypothetical protein n=1 Tax=unclassified Micromonospora TaxID=2617518 RepID=UPI0033CA7D7E